MKAARDYNPQSKNWRVRYIDEKTGLLRVRYYNMGDNAEDFVRFVRYYPKFCPECGRKLESYGRG